MKRLLTLTIVVLAASLFTACPKLRKDVQPPAEVESTLTCWVVDSRTGVATHGPCP